MHSPIPWMGGKRRLAGHLLSVMPQHICYVEPFAGGAAVLFARPEPAKCEVINDLDGDLINFYRVIKHHLEEFARQFKWALVSREIFKWEAMTPVETLTDIQRAARFYYLQKSCFGAKSDRRTFGTSTTGGPKLNLCRMEEDISAAHLRLSRVLIEHLDWAACVEKYDRPATLFLVDPPYLGLAGYRNPFPADQYQKLADTVASLKGKAIITLNDHPEILRTFGHLRHDRLPIKYTVGGPGAATSTEVIFYNYSPPVKPPVKPV